jgi:zinc protease
MNALLWVLLCGVTGPTAELHGVAEHKLENGLTVLLAPEPSVETFTLYAAYAAGSAAERDGERGLAHFLEHVTLRGLSRHKDLPRERRDRGSISNGSTDTHYTQYLIELLSTPENLEWAIDVEADRLGGAIISDPMIATEMTVVRNELEGGANVPTRQLTQEAQLLAYPWSDSGKWTIGTVDDLAHIDAAKMRAFYQRNYRPEKLTLIFTGRFDADDVLARVKRHFAPLRGAPVAPHEFARTLEPLQRGARTFALHQRGDTQGAVVAYRTPSSLGPDHAALEVLQTAMGSPRNSRLADLLVKSGSATSVESGIDPAPEQGLMMFVALTGKKGRPEGLAERMAKELEALADRPLSDEVVARAKAKWLKSWHTSFSAPSKLAPSLSRWSTQGDWRRYFTLRDEVEAVTPAAIQASARRHLVASNRVSGWLLSGAPAAEPVVPAPLVLASAPVKSRAVQGEPVDGSVEKLVERTAHATVGRDLRVVVLRKGTRNERVRGALTLHLGDERSLRGEGATSRVLARLLLRGTAAMSPEALEYQLDRLLSQASVSWAPGAVELNFETSREAFPELFRLLVGALRAPRFTDEALAAARAAAISAEQEAESQAAGRARRATTAALRPFPADAITAVRQPAELIRELEKVTLSQVQSIHRRVYGGQLGELVLVGPVELGEVVEVAREGLEPWRSKVAPTRLGYRFEQLPPASGAVPMPGSAGAAVVAGIRLPISRYHPDYPLLWLVDRALGATSVGSRLGERLRQKEGLSYSASSQLDPSRRSDDGWWLFSASCHPANVEKLTASLTDELSKLVAEGLSEEELARARSSAVRELRTGRSREEQLLNRLQRLVGDGKDLAWERELERSIEAATVTEVKAALQRHLRVDQLSVFRAGDFPSAPVR